METQTNGSYMALHGPHIFIYGNMLCITHKDLTTRFSPSQNGEYPQDLIALTPLSSHKENPLILRIWGSSPPLYKQQFSSFPRYAENPYLSHYRVLRDFSFIDLTFGGSLASTTPVPFDWFLFSHSTGTHRCNQEPLTHR